MFDVLIIFPADRPACYMWTVASALLLDFAQPAAPAKSPAIVGAEADNLPELDVFAL